MPRHTKQDVLTQRDFELLLEGATRLDDPTSLHARFVSLVGGRLGLRPGEVAHLSEDWINWRHQRIEIPEHDNCTKGRHGDDICGYCRNMARQKADADTPTTFEEARNERWTGKTENAARFVPFGFDPRTEIVLERMFDQHDSFPRSRSVVNQRVKRAAEAANELDPSDVFPHALRATAATFHAARGVDLLPLQSMFGWADLQVAQHYLQNSPEHTARALESAHSR